MNHTLRTILLIEDNPGDARLIEEHIREFSGEYQLIHAIDLKSGLQCIEQHSPEVVLLDLGLPDSQELEGIEKIRAVQENLPVVILTGLANLDLGLSAVKAGAQDFLLKDELNNHLLQRTLDYAIERAYSEKTLKQRNHVIGLLYSASTRMSQSLNADVIYQIFHDIAKDALHFNDLSVFTRTTNEDLIHCVFAYDQGQKLDCKTVSPSEKVTAYWDSLHKKPLIFSDPKNISESNTVAKSLTENNSKQNVATILAPMMLQKQIVGIVQISKEDDAAYTSEDILFFISLVSQLTIAINNAELYEKSQIDAVEMARLYRASITLINEAAPNLQALANRIVNVILQEFGKANCSLILAEPYKNQLNRIATAGPYSNEVKYGQLYQDGPGVVPLAIRTGKIINVSDVYENEAYIPNWKSARAELAVPLKVGDKVIGVLDVQSESIDAFSAKDERLLTIFAERAALAIENARLFEEAHKRMEQLQALRDIDLAIIGSLDLDIALNVFINQAKNLLHVDALSVLLHDASNNLKFAAGRGYKSQIFENASLQIGSGISGQAAIKRKAKFIQDINELPEYSTFSNFLKKEGVISMIAYPLITKGELVGILEIFHRSRLDPDHEWWAFLESLAGQAAIAIHNASLFEKLLQSQEELQFAYEATLEGWVRALDMRDKETEGHTQRVTRLTLKLAEAMGIPKEDQIHIRRGALLHDIGKMGIPDEILHKPGNLENAEWVIMRQHPEYAKNFLEHVDYLTPAIDIPYYHHERWDGSGYPQGLKGEQIPLSARIFAIIDVWDALSSDRPYRKAWPRDKIIQHLTNESGKHFDPNVVDAFLKLLDELPDSSVNTPF